MEKAVTIGSEETVNHISMKFNDNPREGFAGLSLMTADYVPIQSITQGGEEWEIERDADDGEIKQLGTGTVWYKSDTAIWQDT